jgi:aldose 1-epimerase
MKKEIEFQGQRAFSLETAEDKILLAPQYGARLLRWESKGREIVLWPQDADWSKPPKVRGGNPILFPFIARHFLDGQAEKWRDAEGEVRFMPMHGFARDLPFTVEPAAEDELVMRLENSAATEAFYPYPFIFLVSYKLAPQALTVRFTTTNRGEKPMPYYAGHHFYFALDHNKRKDALLNLPSEQWGKQRPDGSIDFFPAEDDSFSLDDNRAIDRFQIGPASEGVSLKHPAGYSVDFDLSSAGHVPWHTVTTWTMAPESDYYCIEPWLGLPNAVHHHHGLRMLAPGKTEIAECTLRVNF